MATPLTCLPCNLGLPPPLLCPQTRTLAILSVQTPLHLSGGSFNTSSPSQSSGCIPNQQRGMTLPTPATICRPLLSLSPPGLHPPNSRPTDRCSSECVHVQQHQRRTCPLLPLHTLRKVWEAASLLHEPHLRPMAVLVPHGPIQPSKLAVFPENTAKMHSAWLHWGLRQPSLLLAVGKHTWYHQSPTSLLGPAQKNTRLSSI